MRPHPFARASLLVALFALAGCSSGSPRLEGRWHGVRAEGVSGEAAAPANGFATGTELDVKGDTITVTTTKDKQSGRFKVVKEDKTTVTITTDKDGPGEPQTFTFVDNKTMKWAVLDGKSIVFQKQ